MYYVYIIQSQARDLYFGITENLENRLRDHNSGKVKSTRLGKPWRYVYVEGYRSKTDAESRELILKQYGNARTYVKNRIKRSLL